MKNKPLKGKKYYQKYSDIEGYQWKLIDGIHYLWEVPKIDTDFVSSTFTLGGPDPEPLYPPNKEWLIKIVTADRYKIYFNFNYIITNFPASLKYNEDIEVEMMIFEYPDKMNITEIKQNAVDQIIYNFGLLFYNVNVIPSKLDKIDDLLDSI